ncbi:putative reverse transcriptase domain, reverse transcriptase zinc-binding domain protein [Tanacetum coccineum]
MKESLTDLVSVNESAFGPGRHISNNILLTQEIMHNYHLDRGTPRCAFKVDIQKAYDTVDWKFLHDVLIGFRFHSHMIGWIMECVTSTSFSLSINGNLHGYFKGKRGLRQGDPMSPYLFTLVMEVFTRMLHRRACESGCFTYHRYCSKLNLINLCFADDLFLFSHGDVESARVIMDKLEEFNDASGLTPSLPKSTTYFCYVLNHTKFDILNVLPFEEDKLPTKYLGVPLVLSRLLYRDCKELMEKVKRRISDWENKSLSLAGRAQLIRWCSLMLELEQLMRGFLWCQGDMRKGKAKVAWEVVCLPKKEGGLGIRRLEVFNKALITSHIWSLLLHKESLWVKWIHTYKLNGRSFWEIPLRGKMSLGWRKILQIWLVLSYANDGLVWRDSSNVDSGCSVAMVWNCIRLRFNQVDWYHVVWFSHQILGHAINLLLVVKRKLKTQDTLRQWDIFTGMSNIHSDLSSIVDFLIPMAKMRSARSIIAKLVFAASCYFIWQEQDYKVVHAEKAISGPGY